MISVHLLTREEVAARLEREGCTRHTESIPEHSCWQTAWGYFFLVPEIGPDGMTPEWDLEDMLAELKNTAPRAN